MAVAPYEALSSPISYEQEVKKSQKYRRYGQFVFSSGAMILSLSSAADKIKFAVQGSFAFLTFVGGCFISVGIDERNENLKKYKYLSAIETVLSCAITFISLGISFFKSDINPNEKTGLGTAFCIFGGMLSFVGTSAHPYTHKALHKVRQCISRA